MPKAVGYRQQAEMLRNAAAATTDEDLALAYRLRAIEYDHLAEEAEGGSQAQQHGTQPPPAAPGSSHQPAQQQQQIQPADKDE